MQIMKLNQVLGAWYPILRPEFNKDYMVNIGRSIGLVPEDKLQPAYLNIFRSLELTPPESVKVVIIGQDPYPGGEADGLAFSSNFNSRVPYSLQVIFDELEEEGFGSRFRASLDDWAEQGVLLLNTHLTTVLGTINAHANIGWDEFTSVILDRTVDNTPVYMVWGNPAKALVKQALPAATPNLLFWSHPAATRYGSPFKGCGHFKEANRILESQGKKPIIWNPK